MASRGAWGSSIIRPPISIIVVNFNAGRRLQECVASALPAGELLELIVVDNASADDSLSLLENHHGGDPRLRVVRNARNHGFAVACNQGTALASGECLLFLNPDCQLEEGALSTLLEALRSDPRAGMVGGLLLNPDGSEQAGGRRAVPTPWLTLVRAFRLRVLERRYPRLFADFNLHNQALPTGPTAVDAISGACMLVTRAALDDVGGLDEGYFLHCEDLDWCMRFRQLGWSILFVPGARVIHYQGTCSDKRPLFVEWHKHRGMMRFYHRFFRHRYPGPLMWLVGLAVWLRFTLLACAIGIKRALTALRGSRIA